MALTMVEFKRQLIHISPIAFASLLRYITKWHALALGIVITLIFFSLMHLGNELKRERFDKGALIYPVIVLLLILIYPKHIAAFIWAVFALGDGFATIFGSSFGKIKLFWNKNKSYVGLISFFLTSIVGAGFFMWFVNPALEFGYVIIVSILISFICAFVETFPLKIDDNITVPLAGAVLMAVIHFM